jgi:murein DD-endopeptidase MepM/ murein hydrolase activator NlpD
MRLAVLCFSIVLVIASCKTSGPSLFGKRSLHQQYADKLENAGLKNTLMGAAWFKAADAGLSNPVNINLPYKEIGYFPADAPYAVGVRFTARRGERISISLDKRSSTPLVIYMELWRDAQGSSNQKLIVSNDTTLKSFSYDVDSDETLILRLQPELLNSGEYTLTIQNGSSLAFPVKTNKPAISSFWGDPRDAGARKHEGVDIFATKGTPLLAAADGTISRVETTNIGGKVVWLRTEDKNLSLYYAHLDEQLVTAGQKVKAGDVIGTVGNTGNAKTTNPHLHFGIYTYGGAIDPAIFIQPARSIASEVSANISIIGDTAKSNAAVKAFANPSANSITVADVTINTPVRVLSATSLWFKVVTPAGVSGYVPAKQVSPLSTLSKLTTKDASPLLDQPIASAARKALIQKGETVELLGRFQNYYYVQHKNVIGWMLTTQ